MQSCSCVCREWNCLVSGSRKLSRKRDFLNVYEPVHTIHTFGRKGKKNGQFNNTSGICIDERGMIFVSDYNNAKIQVFNQRGHFIECFGSSRTIGFPNGIATCPYGIIVVNRDHKLIQVFNKNYKLLSSIPVGRYYPKRVCYTKEGQIIVTTIEPSVLVFNMKGELVRQFGSKGCASGKFLFPLGICVNHRGQIIVSDYQCGTIQTFDRNGEFLSKFGVWGSEPSQLKFPKGVCVDEDDNILVADSGNKRISIFNPEGLPIKQLNTSSSISDLCILGRRIFTCGDYCIYIYFQIKISLFFSCEKITRKILFFFLSAFNALDNIY